MHDAACTHGIRLPLVGSGAGSPSPRTTRSTTMPATSAARGMQGTGVAGTGDLAPDAAVPAPVPAPAGVAGVAGGGMPGALGVLGPAALEAAAAAASFASAASAVPDNGGR